MKTIVLEFTKKVPTGAKNKLNEPVYSNETFEIDGCLIAPLQEPIDRVESAALDRNVAIVRLHMPKTDSTDISDCTTVFDGQVWRIIGKPVKFMDDNTPTLWNRYVRAEAVNG